MRIIEQDITKVPFGTLIHAVNCKGAWGAGLAAQFKKLYPKAYQEYLQEFKHYQGREWMLLGRILIHKSQDVTLISCFTQYDVGINYRRTEYCAVEICLSRLAQSKHSQDTLYIPFQFGCGLGGGDWTIVQDIIHTYIPKVIICKNG